MPDNACPTLTSDIQKTPVPLLDISRQNAPLQKATEKAIQSVCNSGAFVHGPECRALEQEIADYCGTKHAVGCASGSDALLLALMAYDIGPGDEVLLPSFTFFATASAVTRLGAKPIFVEIDEATFNFDVADAESKITSKTRAILPVHLFGQCADMNRVGQLAETHNLVVIEDAAQAIGATYNGKRAGSLGDVGCFSFYPTKNLGAFGDGGIITTSDETIADKLRILRDHGQHPRYTHHCIGINSRLDSIQAAILRIKLPLLDAWAEGRKENAARYEKLFSTEDLLEHFVLPKVENGCETVWNQYTIRVKHGLRDALQSYLAERSIGSAIYYPIPLHQQQCFVELGCADIELPVTEKASEEVLSLPIFPELTEVEQKHVVNAIASFAQENAMIHSNAA